MSTKRNRRAANSAARAEKAAGEQPFSIQENSTNSRSKATLIRAQGRVVGRVVGDVFERRIRGSVHILRRPRALCCDVQALADADAAGAVVARVTDTETGRVYSAPLARILADGFTVNRGFGEQRGLTIERWEAGNGAQLPPPPPAPVAVNSKTTEREAQAYTLPLFGGLGL